MEVKLDLNKMAKKVSRESFMGMDTRTRLVPSKKVYKRKQKHRNHIDV